MRSGITDAEAKPQEAGLIRYQRGRSPFSLAPVRRQGPANAADSSQALRSRASPRRRIGPLHPAARVMWHTTGSPQSLPKLLRSIAHRRPAACRDVLPAAAHGSRTCRRPACAVYPKTHSEYRCSSRIGTANPPRHSKAECWEAFKASDWFLKLDRRAHIIAETVLTKDNGIASRSLAVGSLDEVFAIDPDTLHGRFLTHAPSLATAAGTAALQEAGLAVDEVDGLVISTCTGYLCPGLTSYVIERLGLRPDVLAFDLVGQGCAAALPNWRLADALLAADSCRHVLSICVEVSSAAMYLDNDPGVLISACLFGDGAGAAVLSSKAKPQRRSIERGTVRICRQTRVAKCCTGTSRSAC